MNEISEGVISSDLVGNQVVDEETTQLNENRASVEEELIGHSTEDVERTVP